MSELLKKHCVPCEGGTPSLSLEKINDYLKETPEWEVEENKKIKRDLKFKDFKEAINFINKVAELAESEGHHPNIHIYYNKVRLELWTHAINGLFINDFIMAAKINEIYKKNV